MSLLLCALGPLRADQGGPWPDPHAPPPAPAIEIMQTRGTAPFAVHVHALNSHLGVGDSLTARYMWDFGDPNGRFNTLVGWNAAHIYDHPGRYLITLTVTNERGRSSKTRVEVTVAPDDRRRVFISAEGDDSNPGTSPDIPLRTFAGAMRRLHHGTTVLFRRGDMFDVSASVEVGWRNWVLMAYGDDPHPPVLRWVGDPGWAAMIGMDAASCRDAVVDGLRFDSRYADTPERDIVDALRPAGTNITVRNCTFGDLTTAINAERDPVGLFTLDNGADGLRAYFVWGEGSDHCHLGNTVRGSTIEHNLRFAGAERVLIAHNDLTNQPKRTIWAMTGQDVYIAHNTLRDGRLTVGPNHALGDPADRMSRTVVEANLVDKPSGSTPALEIEHGAEHVSIRNNVIRTAGTTTLRIAGRSETMNRNAADVRIVCNTAVNNAETGRFLECGADATGVLVADNLYVCPTLITGEFRSAILFILDGDLSGFDRITDNVWPQPAEFRWVDDGYHYLWERWSDADGYLNIAEWAARDATCNDAYANVALDGYFRPAVDSGAVGHARRVPGVFTDLLGYRRPLDGRWTAGALEVR
ncbi:MAG: right-handed parallel beta-helix repeat-containing protein [Phycisphaerales bacterium]|nr:MAG: right-handed parallel beta-helix repeat-containing protein [Phycisphaerales bacterium]